MSEDDGIPNSSISGAASTMLKETPSPIDEQAAYASFISTCEGDLQQLRTQLALAEARMKWTCGPASNFVWIKSTEAEVDQLRGAVAAEAAKIMEYRHRTGYSGATRTDTFLG